MAYLPTVSIPHLLRTMSTVVVPPVVKGPIVRRPRAVGLMERLDADSRAVTQMQRLRDEYGPDPVQLRVPGRRFALVLDPDDVHRVLNESPVPFSPASLEKRGALEHFQPEGVLVSDAADRAKRRPFNEAVLQPGPPVHPRVGMRLAEATVEEVDVLLGHVDFVGHLDWDGFIRTWQRIVRRVVLGARARDEEQITDDLLALRQRANFSYFGPKRPALRDRFLQQLQDYLDRAEPGSLAHIAAHTPADPGTMPHQQLPQWLFAFDAASWASMRALALLVAHPDAMTRARDEAANSPDLPFLRATILESLRLWPTTPLILRDTTAETRWRTGTLPTGTSIVIFAPFFHRDETRLEQAHSFSPETWLQDRTDQDWPLVPFSGGPAMCPGRNVVLLVASVALARLVQQRSFASAAGLTPDDMPGLLDPFKLRFSTIR